MVSVTLSREYAPTKIERVQFQVWGTRSRSLLSDQNVQETLDGSLTSWRAGNKTADLVKSYGSTVASLFFSSYSPNKRSV